MKTVTTVQNVFRTSFVRQDISSIINHRIVLLLYRCHSLVIKIYVMAVQRHNVSPFHVTIVVRCTYTAVFVAYC